MLRMTVALRYAAAVLALPLLVAAGPGVRSLPPPGSGAMRTAPPHRDQDVAFDQMREGRIRPLREIEGRVVPRMGGSSYLGPEFDPASSTYRLKFMRGGSVIWVDVDARTGTILGRSGN